jgi:hypothetical protein
LRPRRLALVRVYQYGREKAKKEKGGRREECEKRYFSLEILLARFYIGAPRLRQAWTF